MTLNSFDLKFTRRVLTLNSFDHKFTWRILTLIFFYLKLTWRILTLNSFDLKLTGPVLNKQTQIVEKRSETNEKLKIKFFFLLMIDFVHNSQVFRVQFKYKIITFSNNFQDNSKSKNRKMNFSSDLAYCASFMKMGGGLHILTWDRAKIIM